MRWESVIKKYVEAIGESLDCKNQASESDGWRDGCVMG